jgi:prepilin-type N-terminal cleavage/methylation domain-containing protein
MSIMKKNDCNRGFSLVEILVVIGILGILGSISSYSWQRYVANMDLRTAARDLASDISLCRQKAMGENTNYKMTFEIDKYTVTPDPDTIPSGNTIKSFASYGSVIRLDSLTFSGAVIHIQSRGLLDNGTIKLANVRDSKAIITVDRAGRTHVEFTMQ